MRIPLVYIYSSGLSLLFLACEVSLTIIILAMEGSLWWIVG